jgi:rubrerythrin
MSSKPTQDSQGNTGTEDLTYNLVSILYHSLQGAETYDMYIKDAEGSGNQDLAQFFRDVKQENERRAERAKQLLAKQFGQDRQPSAPGQPRN